MIATQQIELPVHLRHLTVNQPPPGQQGQQIKFVNPNEGNYERNIRYAGDTGLSTYKQGELVERYGKAPTVIVAGSGPSLKDPEVLAGIREAVDAGAIIFACKAAIKVLHDAGFEIAYGVTMDPGAHIAQPKKIYKAPGMVHLVASSSDPLVFQYLQAGTSFGEWLETIGDEAVERVLEKDDFASWKAGTYVPSDAGEDTAEVKIFHSATGYQHEVKLYKDLFETSTCMGGGYNVVNRAVSAAFFMGAGKMILAGNDCGWRPEQEMYADGPAHRAGVDMTDHGVIDGSPWMTRPDMLASGVALAKLAKQRPDDIKFLGDTLPAKLVEKDDKFLDSCASFNK